MSKLEKMVCECCGGHIDRASLECKSCGAPYRLSEDLTPIRITRYDSRVRTFGVECNVPAYFVNINPENAMHHTLHQLAEQLAEKILPLMEFEHTFNIRNNEYTTYARIRVADPHDRTGYYEVERRFT